MSAPSSSRMLSLMLLAMNAEDLVGDALEVLGLGLLAEDGEAGLELGRLDVGDEAPLEAGAQAVLEAWRSTSAAGRRR